MANVIPEMSAFATNITLRHVHTSSNRIRRVTDNIDMITEFPLICKQNIFFF